MDRLRRAITWSGTDAVLIMVVLWPGERSGVTPPVTPSRPRRMRTYDLEDDGEYLRSGSASEIDLVYDEVRTDLDVVVEEWLRAAIAAGAATPQGLTLALRDTRRDSDAWATEQAHLRRTHVERYLTTGGLRCRST